MNKHLQIKKIMGKHNYHMNLDDFRFQIGKTVITSLTWPSVQSSATGEVLNILMKFRIPIHTPEITDGLYLDSVSTDDRFHDLYEGVHDGTDSDWRPNDIARQEPAPVVVPFLAWQVQDDPDESSPLVVTNQLLETIYCSLPAICGGSSIDPADNITEFGDSTVPRPSTGPKVSIAGKVAQEVADLADAMNGCCGRISCEIENHFYMQMKRLFEFFVSQEHDPNSAAVQLYWGAVYELLQDRSQKKSPLLFHNHRQDLYDLVERVEEINLRANAIHRGVYYKQNIMTSRGEITQQDTISGSVRLLASMVDALGAIFDMIVQAVRDARDGAKQYVGEPGWGQPMGTKVSRYAKNACKLLETARDELVAESTGFSPDENIGPVLTSQAILILLIERLVGGVYGSGNVDIMGIYDECLAQLVSLIP